MSIPIDVTSDLVSLIDWDVAMRLITQKMRAYRSGEGILPIISVQHYLRDALLEGWASAYLRVYLHSRDNLRMRLVKWLAKSLSVSISSGEQRKLSVSQEAIQRLRDVMDEKESLIIDGLWVKIVSL